MYKESKFDMLSDLENPRLDRGILRNNADSRWIGQTKCENQSNTLKKLGKLQRWFVALDIAGAGAH
jgi:hypothetical protein